MQLHKARYFKYALLPFSEDSLTTYVHSYEALLRHKPEEEIFLFSKQDLNK